MVWETSMCGMLIKRPFAREARAVGPVAVDRARAFTCFQANRWLQIPDGAQRARAASMP